MSYTFASSYAIVTKAGANVNSTAAASSAIIAQFSDEAEGFVNTSSRYDWIANSGAIGANFKPILAETISSLAAIKLICYDMSGYTARAEAESMVNILHNIANNNLKLLQDETYREKIK